jgi:predicted TIM-barrel fold metal-dependent hydrolase
VLQETGISISHHLGNRVWLYDVLRRDPTPQAAIFTSMPSLALCEVVAWWILSGTLERFPDLKIVFVEPHLYWIPGFLGQLDLKAAKGRYDFPGITMAPSEYFKRNMAATFMDDPVGLSLRHQVGIENILWSTDFPHPATTWPNSREIVDEQFEHIPDDERELICAGNAARIYGL